VGQDAFCRFNSSMTEPGMRTMPSTTTYSILRSWTMRTISAVVIPRRRAASAKRRISVGTPASLGPSELRVEQATLGLDPGHRSDEIGNLRWLLLDKPVEHALRRA
jgi:hypothetical protein